MLLPDHEIRALVDAGRIGIDPWDPSLVQPASVDVRLDDTILTLTHGREPLNPEVDSTPLFRAVRPETPSAVAFLDPGGFALGSTRERVRLPADIAARVEGKSSLARLGLVVHLTAGFIDPGWDGCITLELSNPTSRTIVLHQGMKIAQLTFERLTSAAEHPYGAGANGSRYQGQAGPTPSRSHIGFRSGLPAAREAAS